MANFEKWKRLIELRGQCLFMIDTFLFAGQKKEVDRYLKLMFYIENRMRVC